MLLLSLLFNVNSPVLWSLFWIGFSLFIVWAVRGFVRNVKGGLRRDRERAAAPPIAARVVLRLLSPVSLTAPDAAVRLGKGARVSASSAALGDADVFVTCVALPLLSGWVPRSALTVS